MSGISRRQLFRGDLTGRRRPQRPPWALPEAEFAVACDRCGDCVRVCPERVIRVGAGGFPETDFRAAGCSLCLDCVRACGGRALTGDPQRERPFPVALAIGPTCLALRGVVCRACGEACDAGAIGFRLRVGGAAEPRVETNLCSGCGVCLARCPVGALGLVEIEPQPAQAGRLETTT